MQDHLRSLQTPTKARLPQLQQRRQPPHKGCLTIIRVEDLAVIPGPPSVMVGHRGIPLFAPWHRVRAMTNRSPTFQNAKRRAPTPAPAVCAGDMLWSGVPVLTGRKRNMAHLSPTAGSVPAIRFWVLDVAPRPSEPGCRTTLLSKGTDCITFLLLFGMDIASCGESTVARYATVPEAQARERLIVVGWLPFFPHPPQVSPRVTTSIQMRRGEPFVLRPASLLCPAQPRQTSRLNK